MLAHKAEEDGVACVEFIAGKHGHVDYDKVLELSIHILRLHLLVKLKSRLRHLVLSTVLGSSLSWQTVVPRRLMMLKG
jgi:hypothetical protein